MKLLIIEDEEPAAKRLQKMITDILPDAIVLETIDSIAAALKWLETKESPDLIISDIQLSDGISFEIFKNFEVSCPIIFTTAYDQYAIDAFKVNSIDYLLKPIKKDELEIALSKYNKLKSSSAPNTLSIDKLLQAFHSTQSNNYKTRFIVKFGERIRTIDVKEVAYFYTEDKINFLTTTEGRRYTIDFNLDALENLVDPKVFFRINRQYIISIHAIAEMFAYSKSRVLIKLNPPAKEDTIVSTDRSGAFKLWLDDVK